MGLVVSCLRTEEEEVRTPPAIEEEEEEEEDEEQADVFESTIERVVRSKFAFAGENEDEVYNT